MGLLDFFTALYSASSLNSRAFVVPAGKVIPAGTMLYVGIGCGGAAAGYTVTDSRGNTYSTRVSRVNAGTTVNGGIVACRVTTELVEGDSVTITLAGGASSQRWAIIFAWFDDVTSAYNVSVGASQEQSSQFASSTDIAYDPPDPKRALVIGLTAFTSAGSPAVATSGASLIASIITVQGSAERGCALSYEYDEATNRSATFTLAASATIVSMGIAQEADSVMPPSDIGKTATDDAMDALIDAGFVTGSLRDRQMAQHVVAGRTTGSYVDRAKVAGTPVFPK